MNILRGPEKRARIIPVILLSTLGLISCGDDGASSTEDINTARQAFLAENPHLGENPNILELYGDQESDFRLCRAIGGTPFREDSSNSGYTFVCESSGGDFRAFVQDDGDNLHPTDEQELCEIGGGAYFEPPKVSFPEECIFPSIQNVPQ